MPNSGKQMMNNEKINVSNQSEYFITIFSNYRWVALWSFCLNWIIEFATKMTRIWYSRESSMHMHSVVDRGGRCSAGWALSPDILIFQKKNIHSIWLKLYSNLALMASPEIFMTTALHNSYLIICARVRVSGDIALAKHWKTFAELAKSHLRVVVPCENANSCFRNSCQNKWNCIFGSRSHEWVHLVVLWYV